MANWSNPTLTSLYTDFVTEVKNRDVDLALGLDPATTSPTNVPANAIRWNSASFKYQKWDGSTWNDLSAKYIFTAVEVSGATVPVNGMYLSTTNTLNFSTASTASRLTIDGSGNVTIDSGTFYVDAVNNRVGIGTIGPSYAFDVANSVIQVGNSSDAFVQYKSTAGNWHVGVTGGGAYNFYTGTYGTGAFRMSLDASGNLGLGVTPSALWNSGGNLQIANGVFTASSDATRVMSNVVFSSALAGGPAYITSSQQATQYLQNAGAHIWSTAPSGTAGNAITFTQAMTLTADGYLGIGATSPGSPLTVESSAGNQFKITYPSIASYYLNVTSAGALDINKDGSSRLFIDSSGRLLVGTSSARTPLTHSPSLQVEGVGYAPSTISVIGNSNDINGSYIFIGKSRGTSVGSNTIVQSGDEIGGLDFIATDGTQALRAARITSYVDATPGANDMPGRLVFSTTADGAASPTERMRIDNLGYMQGTVNGLSAGRIPAKQYYRLNTARTGSISTTAQSIFGVGVTLVGSTVYEFEGIYHLSGAYTTFPSNCEFHLLFGGTATLNNIMYMGSGPGLIEEYTYVNNYSTSADGFYSTVATSVRVVDIVAADVSVTYFIKGTVSVNAAGTFIPQYRLTQAPTTAFTTRIGSYFSIWPLGASGANTSIGNWA